MVKVRAENVVFNFDSLFNDNDAAQEMLDNGKSLAILGDSLDVLKSMKEKTVDLILRHRNIYLKNT